MRVATVVGARPQLVKAAAVSPILRARHEEILIHTGQHYDAQLSEIFITELQLPPPERVLGVGSGSHGVQTGRMLAELEPILRDGGFDGVLTYGDTNSTLAAALVAAKLCLPLAHVEAGLRSGDRCMPEEINRVVTDRLSTLLFCPTESAVANLRHEGIVQGVYWAGDVMLDQMQRWRASALEGRVSRFGVSAGGYVLATLHRAENTDDRARLSAMLAALGTISSTVLMPLHPRTREAMARADLRLPANIVAVPPVGYLDMLALESSALAVVTDSGGVQKEAYWLGVPCVTLRSTTEWMETVATGWNVLLGDHLEDLADTILASDRTRPRPELFGPTGASERIVDILEEEWS